MESSEIAEIEDQIAELEKEVGYVPYLNRSDFIASMLNIGEATAKQQNIDLDWRRNNPERLWLECLLHLKSEKDGNTTVWWKMKSWD